MFRPLFRCALYAVVCRLDRFAVLLRHQCLFDIRMRRRFPPHPPTHLVARRINVDR